MSPSIYGRFTDKRGIKTTFLAMSFLQCQKGVKKRPCAKGRRIVVPPLFVNHFLLSCINVYESPFLLLTGQTVILYWADDYCSYSSICGSKILFRSYLQSALLILSHSHGQNSLGKVTDLLFSFITFFNS